MHEAINSARAEAGKRELVALLVDARAVSLPPSEIDRFFAGVRWSELFGKPYRAAFLVTPMLYNGFAEVSARNRGATVRGFFEEDQARAWLIDEQGR
jgi:hypothetical protein